MHKSFFKYLTIGQTEEKWGAYVTSVGYSKIEPNEHYPNQEHPQSHTLTWNRGRILNDYYIVFISKGKGVFGAGNAQPGTVDTGTCFFLYPGIWHRYKPDPKSGWEEYWIGFNGSYMEHLMKSFFDAATPSVNVGASKDMLVLFHKLIDTVAASSIGYPQQVAGITLQILGLVNTISRFKAYENDPVGKLISKAKFILEQSFENQVDMEDIARQLPMGYSSFRKAFKKIAGESPNQYHLNLRLNRAKDLLTTTVLNINEVADQTGFESVYYFSKLFKKKNGISPNAYRKMPPDQEN
jgi:AraC-like DNA-binding protein